MIRRPPRSTRTDTLFPYTTLFRSTSIAGGRVHPFAGMAYATSKAALAALTREMAWEFGPYNVRVNAIAPGEIDTSILSPGTDEIVRLAIPMHRPGNPEDVVSTLSFLCTQPRPDQRRVGTKGDSTFRTS